MASLSNEGQKSLDHVKVAIVDDDDGVRIAYGDLINSYGLATRLYASSEEFMEAPEGRDSSCLILDQKLPGMWGTELQLVLNEVAPALPIIFVTSQNDPATRLKALTNGARAFLAKPIDESELMRSIFHVVGLPDLA
jgi:FixJ family two-component response regulator